jgi:hypothetical protein
MRRRAAVDTRPLEVVLSVKNTVLDRERLAMPTIEPRCEELPERTRVHANFLQRRVENKRLRDARLPDSLLDSGVEEVDLILSYPPQCVAEEPSRSEYIHFVDRVEERLQAPQNRCIVLACWLVRKRVRKAEG